MTDSDYASGQLRAIRALMERATIYRSVSTPTALAGGLLALGALGVQFYLEKAWQRGFSVNEFKLLWLAALAVTGCINVVSLRLQAARRDEAFISAGMKAALKSLAPAFLTAGILTWTMQQPLDLAVLWILLYGIGLLATQHFAPRSLVFLGWAFFLAGSGLALGGERLLGAFGQESSSSLAVSAVMAATFGGFHLVYAAIVRGGHDHV